MFEMEPVEPVEPVNVSHDEAIRQVNLKGVIFELTQWILCRSE